MKSRRMLISVIVVASFVVVFSGIAISTSSDKYTLKVPNGIAFSEFRGYESWQVISVSHNGDTLAAILGNPAMIDAYKARFPGNGKPFPDGVKMAKVHWNAKKDDTESGEPTLHDVDFMVKIARRSRIAGLRRLRVTVGAANHMRDLVLYILRSRPLAEGPFRETYGAAKRPIE